MKNKNIYYIAETLLLVISIIFFSVAITAVIGLYASLRNQQVMASNLRPVIRDSIISGRDTTIEIKTVNTNYVTVEEASEATGVPVNILISYCKENLIEFKKEDDRYLISQFAFSKRQE